MSRAKVNNISDLAGNNETTVNDILTWIQETDTLRNDFDAVQADPDPYTQYYNADRGDQRWIKVADKGVANGVASLNSDGKVEFNLLPEAALGGLQYLGTWDADLNDPEIVDGTGTTGEFYKVGTAGSTTIDGISDWMVGDWIVFDGDNWQKIDQTEVIQSVNGYTGDVVLDYADVDADQAGTAAQEVSDHEAKTDPHTQYLQEANNLSDLNDASAARTNLSVLSETEADAKYLLESNNLSDLNDSAAARTNLSVLSEAEGDAKYLLEANNLSDLDNVTTAQSNLNVYDKSSLYDRTTSDNRFLQQSNNLSDLNDSAAARTNLSVLSETESDNKYIIEGTLNVHMSTYQSTSQTLSDTPATVTFDTIFSDSGDFTLSGGEIVNNAGSSLFVIEAEVSTYISSGTSRSSSRFYLEKSTDGGTSFSTISGTEGYMYNRMDTAGENTGAVSFITTLNSGDIIRVVAERYSGPDTIATLAGGSRLTLWNAKGGESGPTGPAGGVDSVVGETGNVTANQIETAIGQGTNAERDLFVDTAEPTSTDGADGDVWYQYS